MILERMILERMILNFFLEYLPNCDDLQIVTYLPVVSHHKTKHS